MAHLDNARLDIVSEGELALMLAVRLGFLRVPGGLLCAECVHPTLGLVLFWSLPEKALDGTRMLSDSAADGGGLDYLPRLGVALPPRRPATPVLAPILGYGGGRKVASVYTRVQRYLKEVPYADPPSFLDDVGRAKGFRLYTDDWGQVGSSVYALFAVQPAWAYLGK